MHKFFWIILKSLYDEYFFILRKLKVDNVFGNLKCKYDSFVVEGRWPYSWYYLPTPPLGQDMTQGQFFKRSLTGLNSEFSFS